MTRGNEPMDSAYAKEYIILNFLLLLIFVTLYVCVATGGHRLRKLSTFLYKYL